MALVASKIWAHIYTKITTGPLSLEGFVVLNAVQDACCVGCSPLGIQQDELKWSLIKRIIPRLGLARISAIERGVHQGRTL